MQQPRRRGPIRTTASVAVAAALLTAACGGGAPVDVLADAAGETMAQETARIAVTTLLDGGIGQAKQRIDAAGVVHFGERTTEMEMYVGVPGAGFDNGTGAALLSVSRGDDFFVKTIGSPLDAPWTRYSDPSPEAGGLDTLDLDVQMRLLGAGVDELELVEEEADVRGQDARQYEATVDLEMALEAAEGSEERRALEQLSERSERGELPIELWLGDGRLLRLVYVVDVPPDTERSSVPGGTVTTAVEYFDFGVPYAPALPSNVVDPPAESDEDPLLEGEEPAEPEQAPAEQEPAEPPSEQPPAQEPPAEDEGDG